MKKKEEVLDYCPNFDRVVNFSYDLDDVVTDKLIKIYRNFIFKASLTDEKDLQMVKDLDYVLGKYIDDYLFRKEMKCEIVRIKVKKSCTDVIRSIVESVLNIFNDYLFNTTRKITIARWI